MQTQGIKLALVFSRTLIMNATKNRSEFTPFRYRDVKSGDADYVLA